MSRKGGLLNIPNALVKGSLMKVLLRTIALALMLCSLACSKEKKEQKTGPVVSPYELSSTIVAALPPSALGFIYWNSSHPAYQKWRSSSWGANTAAGGAQAPSALMAMPEAEQVLKRAGIDVTNRTELEALISEAVLFFLPSGPATAEAPNDSPSNNITGGLLARSKSPELLDTKIGALRKSLQEERIAVTDVPAPSGKAFRFDISGLSSQPNPSLPHDLIIAWDKGMLVATPDEGALRALSGALSGSLPDAPQLKSSEFTKAFTGIPSADDRFVTGYADLARIAKLSPEHISDLPIQTLAFGFAMTATPEMSAKLTVQPKDDQQRALFAKVGSPVSAEILWAVPPNPLLLLSVEGKWFTEIQEKAPLPVAPEALQGIVRAAVAARTAPLGQSMLPIPDLALIVESSDVGALRDTAEKALLASMSGMGGGGWQDKDIEGTPVRVLAGGFGLSPHLATVGNVLTLSTSETLLKEVLTGLKTKRGAFAETLSAAAKSQLDEKRNVASLYIDFVQLATFLENMQELLKMYAPQQSGMNQDTFGVALNSMRSAGSVSTSLSAEEGAFYLRMFYEPPKK